MTTRYFNVKKGITTGNITLDAASGNITGVGNLNTVGTAVAAFFSGDGYQISNIAGNSITGQVGNSLVSGTVYSNAQPNITSVGTLTSVDVTGNVTAGNVYANAGTIGALNLAGNLTTAAQPNITSVGNLTSLQVGTGNSNVVLSNGNITATGNIVANNFVGNLSGNFTGNIDAPGGNTQIIFNDGDLLGASSAFTFDKAGNLLTVGGNVGAGNVIATGDVSGATLTGTLTTAAQPNVTSVGTLSNLAINASGSVTGANLVSANFVTGTLTTAAQPNITSVGDLTSLVVTGNANVGNLSTAGSVTASGNLSGNNATVTNSLDAGSIDTNTITAKGTADLDLTAGTGNANIVLAPSGTGTVDVSNKRITQVGTPTADNDAATKSYVDSVAQGLDVKASVKAATYAALPAVTYDNGTLGVGATLTANASGALVVDGVTVALNDRILVKNQASATQNGIYVVTTLGDVATAFVLTRATDFDQGSPSGEIPAGFTFVEQGTEQADTGWVCTTNAPVTVGTSNIAFSQFSGAGQYSAGEGLDLNGTTFSVKVDNSTIEISGDELRIKASAPLVTPNIGAATGTSLDVTGAIDAASITVTGAVDAASGAFTGNVTAGNITVTGDISATTISGNLTTATQANITSVGTLTGLVVTGNVDFGSSANVTLGTVANVHISGGSNGQYLKTDGSGGLSFGTVDTDTLTNGTSNVDIPVADGNVTISVGGNANTVVFSTAGANIAGYINATGNLTVANANLGGLATATHFSGDGSNLSNIAGSNVTGQVGNALVAGTVYTAAQPNITSLGTLANLSVSGTTNLGAVGNVTITGGSANYVLATDGTGNLSWVDAGSQGVAGSNTQVQFNDGGSFGASANFTFNTSTNTLTATNFAGNGSGLSNIAGANVDGQVANALVAGTVFTAAQPNITSVGTLTGLTVNGNASANYVSVSNGLTTNRSNVTVVTDTVIDQFAPATFRTAKYVISASGDNGYQSVEALLVHDGVSAYITIYGSVCSNVSADIIDVSSNINGVSGNVTLYATSASPNAKVNIVASYINV
jgi:hypothetical protein